MNTVTALLESAKERLDNSNNSSGLVGNRMHFPMLIHYCGDRSSEISARLSSIFSRIWPQTSDNIVFIYSPSTGRQEPGVAFYDQSTSAGNPLTVEQTQGKLDAIRSMRGVFASMMKWCVYNIIDTSSISDIEEFRARYNLIQSLNSIVDGGTASMLIVLLDESSSKKAIASSIRSELTNHDQYDGAVVISNKTIRCELFPFEELYDIIAGVIVLSNNDAVTQADDDDYEARKTCLFGGRTLTLSYSSLKRPNHKIAMQMIHELLEKVYTREYLEHIMLSEDELCRRLGIQNGAIGLFENGLKQLTVHFPEEALLMLPFKQIPGAELDLKQISYTEFSKLLYDHTFESYLKSYCEKYIIRREQIERLMQQYEGIVKNAVTAAEYASVPDEYIRNVIDQIEIREPNRALSVADYFENYLRYFIKTKIIFPRIKQMLFSLREDSLRTLDSFKQFRTELQRCLPIEGFPELGSLYLSVVENYCNKTSGEQNLKKLLSPGNGYEEFINEIRKMLEEIINGDTSVFSLSFIDEWEQRLNLAGEEIYKQIQLTFEQDFDQKLFLFGNYQRNQVALEVYLFHTTDALGQKPTGLYNHLQKAMHSTKQVQFVNTGCDDIVEAFRFIDCSGNKLIL